MASNLLVITILSVENLGAHDVRLVVSLSGDEKQCTPVHKKRSTTNPWWGHSFEFTGEKAALHDTRLEFKIEKEEPFLKHTFFCCMKGPFFGRKTTYVVGEVDVLLDGCAGDMNPKVRSCDVWSSSLKIVAVLKFSYKFSEPTVTATQAAATPSEPYVPPMHPPLVPYLQNAAPNFPAADPYPPPIPALHHQMAYVPAGPPPPLQHPGWNLLGRVGIAAAVNAITSLFDNLGFDGGDFTNAWF
ncbi:uncharacterized protein LOC125315500 [Rhodamnia argentea]|uniref:Uncharacterized protein LOC125315500 n=1 Tax=Rhodamnia argentea TaxID=178133 RepID=A0ABM3HJ38_9MYRT|nr:uncharacterized protein LOC125315500 [Rhodamnia argentea]